MKSFFDFFMPYIMIGFVIVLMVLGFFIFSYVLLFAIIVGLILFVVNTIRARFFMKKNPHQTPEKNQGRIIDQDDTL